MTQSPPSAPSSPELLPRTARSIRKARTPSSNTTTSKASRSPSRPRSARSRSRGDTSASAINSPTVISTRTRDLSSTAPLWVRLLSYITLKQSARLTAPERNCRRSSSKRARRRQRKRASMASCLWPCPASRTSADREPFRMTSSPWWRDARSRRWSSCWTQTVTTSARPSQ